MPIDLLVKLYDLPEPTAFIARATQVGVTIRRARTPEAAVIIEWVRRAFADRWASECQTAFAHHPVTCFVAVRGKELLGFACYDATAKGLFGPQGVAQAVRGQGIGQALLIATLDAMSHAGYVYAIIGAAGPVGFYRKTVDVIEIPGSSPGFYRDLL